MADSGGYALFIDDYLNDARDAFEVINRALLALEEEPGRTDLVDEAFRAVHNLKSSSAMMQFADVAGLAHAAEDLLSGLRQSGHPPTPAIIELLFEVNDALAALVKAATQKRPCEVDAAALAQQLNVAVRAKRPARPQRQRSQTKGSRPLPSLEKSQTVRVKKELLDRLFDGVGELMITKNRISNLAARSGDKQLQQAVASLGRIVEELRDGVSTARLVPAEEIFQKFPRLVHDLAREAGKEIDLVMEGGGIELDKGVLDAIGEPLIHLLRNAVDHGIEAAPVRQAAGKSKTGTIKLTARRGGERILVEVEDDGGGIDLEQVKRIALAQGLIGTGDAERLTEAGAQDLLFEPGFSSSAQVSDVSGRGVGLDVVRSTVKELGGTIEVNSGRGRGCRFTLKLPLSTVIIQALIVEVGGLLFALPTNLVSQTLKVHAGELNRVGDQELFILDGEVISFLRLGIVLGTGHRSQDSFTAIIVTSSGKAMAIGVDAVVDQTECIVKTLDPLAQSVKGFSGGTIMGDGRIVLLLDIPALLGFETFKGKGWMK